MKTVRRPPAGLLVALLVAVAVPAVSAARPAPTPTPTPRPRLSGGFGRTPVPQATAVAGEPAGDGQGLSDVVRAAGVAKEKKEQKPVAITNESLVKDPNKGKLTTSQPRPGPAPAPAGRPAASGAPPAAGATAPALVPGTAPEVTPAPTAVPLAGATSADEAMWRDKARRARQRVEELKAQITSLESESKRLENDFYRWDDGQYRDRVIKPQWDKAREDLETSKRQLATAEQELADLPEQARKAGALPGWLRE